MPSGKHTGKGTAHARPPELRAAQHPSPPLPAPPDPEEVAPEALRSTIPLQHLPDDDPFVLIDGIDATGGVTGAAAARMSPTAAAAFRRYCTVAPSLRTLVNLHKLLAREWQQAPSYDTLWKWSREHDWERLLREYDLARDRIRWWHEELKGRAANERQAAKGRELAELAEGEIAKILQDYDRGPELLRDPATGEILYNPRTGLPVFGPRPTLAGIQGLAVLYKTATETERVALGLPTMISNSNTKLTAQVETASAPNGLSLEEWREKSRRERLGGSVTEEGPSPAPSVTVRALPAPKQEAPLPLDVAAGLRDADLAALPVEWTEAAE